MDTVQYGNMVDFSLIVPLYVSDLFNVTIEYRTLYLAVPTGTLGSPTRTRIHRQKMFKQIMFKLQNVPTRGNPTDQDCTDYD